MLRLLGTTLFNRFFSSWNDPWEIVVLPLSIEGKCVVFNVNGLAVWLWEDVKWAGYEIQGEKLWQEGEVE